MAWSESPPIPIISRVIACARFSLIGGEGAALRFLCACALCGVPPFVSPVAAAPLDVVGGPDARSSLSASDIAASEWDRPESSRSRFFLLFLTGVPSGFSLPMAMFFSLRILRRMVEFHRFLMALSVRPGTSLAISAHLLPWIFCASMISRSSSLVHGPFIMFGSNWLCHRSRICLPVRLGKYDATSTQLLSPCFSTSLRTSSSSSGVHGALQLFRLLSGTHAATTLLLL
mmetsp:Transcript_20147/g.39110  ORF Transcript_20147/g.39110 Transcript_20147/m.39110 type:complete len:230 (+) Transcript_20147:99-788(+)